MRSNARNANCGTSWGYLDGAAFGDLLRIRRAPEPVELKGPVDRSRERSPPEDGERVADEVGIRRGERQRHPRPSGQADRVNNFMTPIIPNRLAGQNESGTRLD